MPIIQFLYIFATMRGRRRYIVLLLTVLSFWGSSQKSNAQSVKMNVLPEGYHRAYVDGQDTIAIFKLRDVYIFPKQKFRNKRDEAKYWKLVRDVKKTLPFAKIVYGTLIETYEYLETLPTDKARKAHLKRMEKELFAQYKPELKKLSLSQGKLLIKLIDRECNQSSYNLVKAYLGSFRAGFWNIFAGMFGASLKTEYYPLNKDRQIERIVLLVESGAL